MTISATSSEVAPSSGKSTNNGPLIFGEAVFDQFSDGRSVLGGVPSNVACGLRGLGLEPGFVSAVGDDVQGCTVYDRMRSWRLNPQGLQTSPSRSTGEVKVTLGDQQPRFDIAQAGAERRCARFRDSSFFVTCVANGAHCIEGRQSTFTLAAEAAEFCDTVGAGDGFSAATIFVLLRNEPMPKTLAHAAKLTSRIIGIHGATSDDKSLYQEVL